MIAGINNHSNTFLGSHNGGSGYEKYLFYKSIGIGYQNDSHLGVDIMYYWTNDKVYAYSRFIDSSGNYSFVNKNVNGILKIGLSLAMEVL